MNRSAKNRNILKSVIRSIAFRVHRKTELKVFEDRAENSDSSESDREADSELLLQPKGLSRDSFKELLSLLCIETETLDKKEIKYCQKMQHIHHK